MNGLNDAYVESVIKKTISGKLKTGQAAAKLGISKQYVNRLKKAYSEKGPARSSPKTCPRTWWWAETPHALSKRSGESIGKGLSSREPF